MGAIGACCGAFAGCVGGCCRALCRLGTPRQRLLTAWILLCVRARELRRLRAGAAFWHALTPHARCAQLVEAVYSVCGGLCCTRLNALVASIKSLGYSTERVTQVQLLSANTSAGIILCGMHFAVSAVRTRWRQAQWLRRTAAGKQQANLTLRRSAPSSSFLDAPAAGRRRA